MKLCYCLCFFISGLVTNGQMLEGLVLNEDGQPIPNAAVFVNSTSIETTTDVKGNFALKLPNYKGAIVVACDGFQTYGYMINAKEIPEVLTVKLQSSVSQNISYERLPSAPWLGLFVDNFIGSSANARHCKIKNTNALHFYLSQDEKELHVLTNKPLTIENKALGYTIKYYLETFVFNLQNGMFTYKGYCFYHPMEGVGNKQEIWDKNRSEAYHGSLMNFMRSVYRNQIAEEGFEARPLKKIKNVPAFETIKSDTMQAGTLSKDSTKALALFVEEEDYGDEVMNENNYRDIIGLAITGDSIAYRISETRVGLDFSNFLMITYRKKEPPTEYQEQTYGTRMTSQLILINKRPVEIEWNGSYYDTGDLLVLGYWTWAEKIANSLPYDYNPPKTP